jgi:hypothetical protein
MGQRWLHHLAEEEIWEARGTSFLLAEKLAGHGGENYAERGRVGGGDGGKKRSGQKGEERAGVWRVVEG